MATNSKYVYFYGDSYLDLGLDYSGLTLRGQSIQVIGSLGNDRVYLRPGTSVDFVQSGGGIDKLYLEGNIADYTFTASGTTLSLTRGSGADKESALVSGNTNDLLVFADGTVLASAVKNHVSTAGSGAPEPLPVPAGETSTAPVLPTTYAAVVRAVATSATTFAPVKPGITAQLWGSGDVDTVYINPGSTVEAMRLGDGQDRVYFTGAFADYTKGTLGSFVVFERDINGTHEKVTVAVGIEADQDLWIFADGAAGSYNIGTATDTSQVRISGGKIVIDPSFDLDLSSRYAITVDDGAFVGATTHLSTSAVGSSAINFGTVTPGTGASVTNAASSQVVDPSTGQLVAGNGWWSIENVGSALSSKVTADVSSAHVTLVFKDWNASAGDAGSHFDGVGVNQPFWVDVRGFGADDLIYIDDQANSSLTANLLAYTNVDHNGTSPVRLAFDAAPGIGTGGQAWLDITTTQGSAVFDSVGQLATLLGTSTSVVSA